LGRVHKKNKKETMNRNYYLYIFLFLVSEFIWFFIFFLWFLFSFSSLFLCFSLEKKFLVNTSELMCLRTRPNYFHVLAHHNTRQAQLCLTSEFGMGSGISISGMIVSHKAITKTLLSIFFFFSFSSKRKESSVKKFIK